MKYILIIAAISTIYGCYSKTPEKTGLEGKPLPSFNLFLSDSTTYLNTSSIPQGKPIALFFFGPTCPYSRSQMKEIIEDIQILKEMRFYIFTTAPFHEMKKFYSEYHLDKFKNITVGIDYTNFFSDYFKAKGVPYMAIYNKNKELNEAFIGKINSEQIIEASER